MAESHPCHRYQSIEVANVASPADQTDHRPGIRVSDDYVARHPQADVGATELMINVFYAAELLGRRFDRVLRSFGLTRGSHNVLQILGGAIEPLTPTDIMSRIVATSATVTGLIDTLERGALVARHRHPTDRRSTLVAITRGGRALLDELVPVLIEREKAWAAGISAGDRKQLVNLLGSFQCHLRSLEPEG